MYNIKDAVGWIGDVAVFKYEGGYILIKWPCMSQSVIIR